LHDWPDASSFRRYDPLYCVSKDGRMYDRVIANETPGATRLRGGPEERDETVLRKNVSVIRASSVSLMPGGLAKNLSKQNITGVIVYLRGGP
jgi:hypothetical protein